MKLNEKLILISSFFFWNVSYSQNAISVCCKNKTEVKKAIEKNKNVSINLQAYPDADNRLIIFTFNALQPDIYSYSLNDDSNREVMNGIISAQEGVNMHELDMASLSGSSVYILNLSDGKNSNHINLRLQ